MTASKKKLTRGQRVIAFIERYCLVPEGKLIGKPFKLSPFQKKFIIAVYDNKAGTRMGILSMARKNGKTALIAAILLAHVAGPEAKQNSQIVSGAMSRDQASILFKLAAKIVRMSPDLVPLVRIVPSTKTLIGITRNVEYQALAAEAKTKHGLSPVLAVLDEVGQVRGPSSDFIDAITTSQGAHEDPLLLVISTQAPNDGDLLSIWIDDAIESKDPQIVCHLYAADADCELNDESAWQKSNPALGVFRSLEDVQAQALQAMRMPSSESKFRNLTLNQRVETVTPFITRQVWTMNSHAVDDRAFYSSPVFVGIDLSAKTDLTAMVAIARFEGRWHIKPIFWTPAKGLKERAKRDRAPYDVWESQGFIRTIPGAAIDYEPVAREIADALDGCDVAAVAFDRWRFDLLKKEFDALAISLPLTPFGQGFKDMAPAIDNLEAALMNEEIAHGNHPVLTMCMANSRVEKDAAGNRKLNKAKTVGRIDGAIALAMAIGVANRTIENEGDIDAFINAPLILKA